MFGEYEIKKQICEIGKRIYNQGFIAANDGNITVKISDNEIIATPTGISKGFMTPEMLVKTDMNGKVLESYGPYRPSSELKMHLRVYKERPDVKSVVHAHPPYATSFAIAGIPLSQPIMPEAVIALGCVPIAAYGTPSTDEIPDAVSQYLQNYDAVLLENHGALSYSDNLLNAYHKMESLEFYAKLLFISKHLGGPQELNNQQVERLYQLRTEMGIGGKHPAGLCSTLSHEKGGCGPAPKMVDQPTTVESSSSTDELVAQITKRILAELNGSSK